MKTAAATATQSITITGKRSTCARANRPFSRVPSRFTRASAACAGRRTRRPSRARGRRPDARRAAPCLLPPDSIAAAARQPRGHSRSRRDGQSQHTQCGQGVLTHRGRREPWIACRGNGRKGEDTQREQTREPRRQTVAAQHPAPGPARQSGGQRSGQRRRCSTRSSEREAGGGRDDCAGPSRGPAGARRWRPGIRPPAPARRSGPAPGPRKPRPRVRTAVRRHAATSENPRPIDLSDSRLTLYERPGRRRRLKEIFRKS